LWEISSARLDTRLHLALLKLLLVMLPLLILPLLLPHMTFAWRLLAVALLRMSIVGRHPGVLKTSARWA
jgi:hypothetical protein